MANAGGQEDPVEKREWLLPPTPAFLPVEFMDKAAWQAIVRKGMKIVQHNWMTKATTIPFIKAPPS